MRRTAPAEFVLAHTRVRHAPFVPEVRLHLADDGPDGSIELWESTQLAVNRGEIPPPFWAFVWAGGQALARHLLDHPETVTGRRVIDVATGSGLVAIAAAQAGAAEVLAYDIDEFAAAATRLNARLNAVTVIAVAAGVQSVEVDAGDVVTVGDVFYDERIAALMVGELGRLARAGAMVLVGDPHRAYLPTERLRPVASYEVDVETDLEDAPVKPAVVAVLSG